MLWNNRPLSREGIAGLLCSAEAMWLRLASCAHDLGVFEPKGPGATRESTWLGIPVSWNKGMCRWAWGSREKAVEFASRENVLFIV